MKKISVVSGCYNEDGNLEDLVARVFAVAAGLPQYTWEYIIIDNCSTDGSVDVLKRLAAADPRVKVILNARNFGHIRSPYYGLMQAKGDAIVQIDADLQDPPPIIIDFLNGLRQG